MEKQQDITPQMRAILVDWLVEVQECFELYHETLYLGVKLLDHFLERNTIKRDELQLVGATTLLISSKIEVLLKCLPGNQAFTLCKRQQGLLPGNWALVSY